MRFGLNIIVDVEVLEVWDVILVLDFDSGVFVEWPGDDELGIVSGTEVDLHGKIAVQSCSTAKLVVFSRFHGCSEWQ